MDPAHAGAHNATHTLFYFIFYLLHCSLVHVAKLREAALVYAQQKSARYFLSLDTDVMLTEYTAITKLVKARRTATRRLFWTISHAISSSAPPRSRRVMTPLK